MVTEDRMCWFISERWREGGQDRWEDLGRERGMKGERMEMRVINTTNTPLSKASNTLPSLAPTAPKPIHVFLFIAPSSSCLPRFPLPTFPRMPPRFLYREYTIPMFNLSVMIITFIKTIEHFAGNKKPSHNFLCPAHRNLKRN